MSTDGVYIFHLFFVSLRQSYKNRGPEIIVLPDLWCITEKWLNYDFHVSTAVRINLN